MLLAFWIWLSLLILSALFGTAYRCFLFCVFFIGEIILYFSLFLFFSLFLDFVFASNCSIATDLREMETELLHCTLYYITELDGTTAFFWERNNWDSIWMAICNIMESFHILCRISY